MQSLRAAAVGGAEALATAVHQGPGAVLLSLKERVKGEAGDKDGVDSQVCTIRWVRQVKRSDGG
jgi:hypothetical protein